MSGSHEANEARVTTRGRSLDGATATPNDPPWTKLSRDIEAFLAEETAIARVDEPSSATHEKPSTLVTQRGMRPPRPAHEDVTDGIVGSQIGHYEVVSCLGRGGMGAVYRCRHRLVHSHVAIKLLHDGVDDPTVFERFVREARAANVIASAHVLPILDFGQLPDGRPYAVMEQLIGESVEARFVAHGPLPLSEVADLCRQTALGMAAAHEVGILHRDLKPANLFLERRADGAPFVRILDFGVCKITENEDDARLTVQGFCVGTPQFCSPEQATARSVSEATDIYSLGAVAYELLSGAPTFEGSSIDLMVRKNLTDPISIGALCPWLPEAAVALISEMLDRRPEARPRSMIEVARRFAALVHTTVSTPPASLSVTPSASAAARDPLPTRRPPDSPRAPMQSVLAPHTPIAMSQIVKLPVPTARVGRVVIGALMASCVAILPFLHRANVAPVTHGVSAALAASSARAPVAAASAMHDAASNTARSKRADVASAMRLAIPSAVASSASLSTANRASLRSMAPRASSVAASPSKPTAAPTSSPLVDPFQ